MGFPESRSGKWKMTCHALRALEPQRSSLSSFARHTLHDSPLARASFTSDGYDSRCLLPRALFPHAAGSMISFYDSPCRPSRNLLRLTISTATLHPGVPGELERCSPREVADASWTNLASAPGTAYSSGLAATNTGVDSNPNKP